MMWCPRLDHFARFNPDGSITRCGHMVNPKSFQSFKEMEHSAWLKQLKEKMANGKWPMECSRCQQTESLGNGSIRLNSIKLHEKRVREDYLQIGGVLDNVCNSACQFCNANLSTKIGSLSEPEYIKVDNYKKFQQLPLERIEHLDINGGEPSTSKNYRDLLSNLPPNLKTLRINTNCSKIIPNLELINDSGVQVTVTVSFDGLNKIHDYVRWPIRWQDFVKNLMIYRSFKIYELNLWTTVNALNINDLPNIFKFVTDNELNHSYAFLTHPHDLNVHYSNQFTLRAKENFQELSDPRLVKISEILAIGKDNTKELESFIAMQDKLRKIRIDDYISIY